MASVVEPTAAAGGARAGFRSISTPDGLVAVVAIAAAAAALIHFDLSARAFVAAFFAAVLVVLAAIDLERQIIPNRIVVPAGVLVLLGDIAAEPQRAKEWTAAAFGALLVALAISLATRGGVGMGDVKLAFLLGAGLGSAVLGAAAIAMFGAFLVSVPILVRGGLGARKATIPLGPFLALGALIALFLS
jgi:prepilin signal peptidase PulO-like enzyme (type II secretory pathway)